MEFGILGPLQVTGPVGTSIALPTGRQREVLLRLLVACPAAVAADRLAEDLFAGEESRGASTVRTYVARLRSGLGAEVVVTRDGGYALDVAPDHIDARRFERLVEEARDRALARPEEASGLVDQALALWRGDPLADVADRTWASATVSRLEELRIIARETRVEVALQLGRHRELLPELAELTSAHPLREALWVNRMVALYRSGRQAEALACYREVSQVLQRELGIEPGPHLRSVHRAVLTQDPTLHDSVPLADRTPVTAAASRGAAARARDDTAEAPTNIAAARGQLFGRDQELRELVAALGEERLVTLTGVGGVGKSRLAIEVASTVRPSHADGVWWLDLAALSDRAGLHRALADLLDVPRRADPHVRDLLIDHLADRRALLLLDNGEHLLDSVAHLVADLVERCPGLTILVTSREALGLAQEWVWSLAPLSVGAEGADPEELLASDAVALFARRAGAVSPGFVVDTENVDVVARICRRLDGIPLAIELAAARMRVLTPEDVDDRLDQRFRLLTGGRIAVGRHRTLRNAIDWSYELLEPNERVAFRRLSVFGGQFDLDGAAAVLPPGEGERSVIDLVGRLIDRSLLVVDRTKDGIQYRMLETIRQYALDRLEDAEELVDVRHAHADHVRAVVERAGRLLQGPEERTGHALLRQLHDDLTAAVQWLLVSGRSADAAHMIRQIRWDRVDRRLALDTTRWARLLAADPDLHGDDVVVVQGLAAMGWWLEGNRGRAIPLAQEALRRARPLDMAARLDAALPAAWVLWEAEATDSVAEEVLPMADPEAYVGVPPDVAAVALSGIAVALAEMGVEGEEAEAFVERLIDASVEYAERAGAPTVRAMTLHARGLCILDRDPDGAERDFRACASLEGLAWPVWSLHARAHLLRRDALAGRTDRLLAELADVLAGALDHANELHLRLIAGFAGAAVILSGPPDLAAAFAPLVHDVHATEMETWRASVAQLAAAVERSGAGVLANSSTSSSAEMVSTLLAAVRRELVDGDAPQVSPAGPGPGPESGRGPARRPTRA